MNEKENRSVHL